MSHAGNQEQHLEEPKSPTDCVFLSSSWNDWNKLLNSHVNTGCGVNNRSLQFNDEFHQTPRPRFTTPGPSSEALSERLQETDWYLPRMHHCRCSASPNLSRQSLSKVFRLLRRAAGKHLSARKTAQKRRKTGRVKMDEGARELVWFPSVEFREEDVHDSQLAAHSAPPEKPSERFRYLFVVLRVCPAVHAVLLVSICR